MISPDDRRDDAADDTKPLRFGAADPGPSPESVSGVVRVDGLREQAAASASPAPPAPPPASRDQDDAVVAALADVTFPTAWRGYEPTAVDAYVRRVSQALSTLEETRTPQDVVRRALDRVGEETAAILREAEEAAQRITTKSRADAAERVQKAEREAHDITQRARARLRELDADIDRIWIERQRIIDDTRKLADRLCHVADQAEERFPPEDAETPAAGPSPRPGPAAGRPALAPVPAPAAAPTQPSKAKPEPPKAKPEPPKAKPATGARPQGADADKPPTADRPRD